MTEWVKKPDRDGMWWRHIADGVDRGRDMWDVNGIGLYDELQITPTWNSDIADSLEDALGDNVWWCYAQQPEFTPEGTASTEVEEEAQAVMMALDELTDRDLVNRWGDAMFEQRRAAYARGARLPQQVVRSYGDNVRECHAARFDILARFAELRQEIESLRRQRDRLLAAIEYTLSLTVRNSLCEMCSSVVRHPIDHGNDCPYYELTEAVASVKEG